MQWILRPYQSLSKGVSKNGKQSLTQQLGPYLELPPASYDLQNRSRMWVQGDGTKGVQQNQRQSQSQDQKMQKQMDERKLQAPQGPEIKQSWQPQWQQQWARRQGPEVPPRPEQEQRQGVGRGSPSQQRPRLREENGASRAQAPMVAPDEGEESGTGPGIPEPPGETPVLHSWGAVSLGGIVPHPGLKHPVVGVKVHAEVESQHGIEPGSLAHQPEEPGMHDVADQQPSHLLGDRHSVHVVGAGRHPDHCSVALLDTHPGHTGELGVQD